MRVLHLVDTADGATAAATQAAGLVRSGVEVHVALPGRGRAVQAWRDAGAVVHFARVGLVGRGLLSAPLRMNRVRGLVGLVQPDIVHTHHLGATVAARLALGRDHDTPRLFQVSVPLHLEHPITRDLELRFAGGADWWAGGCRWIQDTYRGLDCDPARVSLAYYGHDLAAIRTPPRGPFRRELGLGDDVPLIGAIGDPVAPYRRLGQTSGLRGHEDLIAALDALPGVHAVVIGSPAPRSRAYARALANAARARLGDRIRFLPDRDDLDAVLADLDAVVCPDRSAGVGAAALAQLRGVPTIATEVGGHIDVVREPATGWLPRSESPPDLADAIRQALADPAGARARAATGRQRASELLDLERTTTELIALYGRMTGG